MVGHNIFAHETTTSTPVHQAIAVANMDPRPAPEREEGAARVCAWLSVLFDLPDDARGDVLKLILSEEGDTWSEHIHRLNGDHPVFALMVASDDPVVVALAARQPRLPLPFIEALWRSDYPMVRATLAAQPHVSFADVITRGEAAESQMWSTALAFGLAQRADLTPDMYQRLIESFPIGSRNWDALSYHCAKNPAMPVSLQYDFVCRAGWGVIGRHGALLHWNTLSHETVDAVFDRADSALLAQLVSRRDLSAAMLNRILERIPAFSVARRASILDAALEGRLHVPTVVAAARAEFAAHPSHTLFAALTRHDLLSETEVVALAERLADDTEWRRRSPSALLLRALLLSPWAPVTVAERLVAQDATAPLYYAIAPTNAVRRGQHLAALEEQFDTRLADGYPPTSNKAAWRLVAHGLGKLLFAAPLSAKLLDRVESCLSASEPDCRREILASLLQSSCAVPTPTHLANPCYARVCRLLTPELPSPRGLDWMRNLPIAVAGVPPDAIDPSVRLALLRALAFFTGTVRSSTGPAPQSNGRRALDSLTAYMVDQLASGAHPSERAQVVRHAMLEVLAEHGAFGRGRPFDANRIFQWIAQHGSRPASEPVPPSTR
jgi:hypothetical protein